MWTLNAYDSLEDHHFEWLTTDDGNALEQFVEKLTLDELTFNGVSLDMYDWNGPRTGADAGTDLKYAPRAGASAASGRIIRDSSRPHWFSCKAGSTGWRDKVLEDLQKNGRAKEVAQFLSEKKGYFVVAANVQVPLETSLGRTKKGFPNDVTSLRDRIEWLLCEEKKTTFDAHPFRSQIVKCDVADFKQVLATLKPHLKDEWMTSLGIVQLRGFTNLIDFATEFKEERANKADFVADTSRTDITKQIQSLNGQVLVVCAPPGQGKTHAVIRALEENLSADDRARVVCTRALRHFINAVTSDALPLPKTIVVIDDCLARDVRDQWDSFSQVVIAKGGSVVQIVSAPKSVIERELDGRFQNEGPVVLEVGACSSRVRDDHQRPVRSIRGRAKDSRAVRSFVQRLSIFCGPRRKGTRASLGLTLSQLGNPH